MNIEQSLKQKQIISNQFLLILLALSFILRIFIAWNTIGTNDITTWETFANYIKNEGLFNTYSNFDYSNRPLMNHPPIAAYLNVFILYLSEIFKLSYYFLFRLFMIFADGASCYLIYKIYKKNKDTNTSLIIANAYAWSIIGIIISSFHGNTDSLYAFLCLLVAYLIHEIKSFFWVGTVLACAINIKLIPAILVIPAFFLCRNKKDCILLFTSLGIGALPYLYGLFIYGDVFFNNVINYKGSVSHFLGILHLTTLLLLSNTFESYYIKFGGIIILFLVFVLSNYTYRKKSFSSYEIFFLCISIFLLFNPGWAVQYSVAILPVFFIVNYRLATIYGFLSGVTVSLFYFSYWTGESDFYSNAFNRIDKNTAAFYYYTALSFITYVALARFFVQTLRKK